MSQVCLDGCLPANHLCKTDMVFSIFFMTWKSFMFRGGQHGGYYVECCFVNGGSALISMNKTEHKVADFQTRVSRYTGSHVCLSAMLLSTS